MTDLIPSDVRDLSSSQISMVDPLSIQRTSSSHPTSCSGLNDTSQNVHTSCVLPSWPEKVKLYRNELHQNLRYFYICEAINAKPECQTVCEPVLVPSYLVIVFRPVGWGGSVGSDEPPHRGH